MRLWVSRSEPGASRQAEALRAAGFDVVVAPVLNIEATGREPPIAPRRVPAYQHVIFLSEQAVRHGARAVIGDGARIHAIGRQTAQALLGFNITAEVPELASSEGLIEHFAREPLAGQTCLIVAGEGGRKTLADYLAGRGAEVIEYLCYRRVAADVPASAIAGVTHLLVASQDGFRAMARLWFSSGGGADVKVIVASDRIAALGSELGMVNIQVATGAADEDWIAALEQQ